MFFIVLLALAAFALAGAAEFFSVWGLAHTFAGVFWSVVIMGAALGAGKLMGVSYLYRYWDQTHWALKGYLFAGIAVLMILTSGGIFGYLSSGYQQDILPLKQKQGQVQLMVEERERSLARKKQIDDLLAGGPTVKDVDSAQATRALRETTRARESQSRQYREEHKQLTLRIAQLDAETLKLKGELLQSEAHVGPIIYIAQAFNLETDDATKWLIFLIIFAFDPMAIALTLCFNIALRLREEEQKAKNEEINAPEPEHDFVHHAEDEPLAHPQRYISDPEEDALDEARNRFDFEAQSEFMKPIPVQDEPANDFAAMREFMKAIPEPVVETEPELVAEPVVEPQVEPVVMEGIPRSPRTRPFANMWTTTPPPSNKIAELGNHYRILVAKEQKGQPLTKDELWERDQIERILRQHGFDKYLRG